MKLEDLLQDVEPRWHRAFIQFVQTGDASADFLHYLDRDARGQQAVERAFAAQVEALQGLAQVIKAKGREKLQPVGAPERPSMVMARAVELVMELRGHERSEAVADAAATLARRAGADGAVKVRSTLSELEQKLATFAE
jgi:hypothetical protein